MPPPKLELSPQALLAAAEDAWGVVTVARLSLASRDLQDLLRPVLDLRMRQVRTLQRRVRARLHARCGWVWQGAPGNYLVRICRCPPRVRPRCSEHWCG
jgi:hypothetical protein